MDPTQDISLHPSSSSRTPSLICVGGMLRVADASPFTMAASPAGTPCSAVRYRKDSTHSLTTNNIPVKALTSPFTGSSPFLAPTSPFSYSVETPIPLRSSQTQTPVNLQGPISLKSFSKPANDIIASNRGQVAQTETQSTSPHLLTPKQVRELRRLCRKTANRAEFEDRLIQIRQVASIAAMASSSLHLFDPENPQSGQALRLWVETHRAGGADWRDERPLCDAVIEELRRWDRLLKAWARVRFETFHTNEPLAQQQICASSRHNTTNVDLQPVRLQFDQLSVGSLPVGSLPVSMSPTTPLNRVRCKGIGVTKKPDFGPIAQMVSPTTPEERNGFFSRSLHANDADINLDMNEVLQASDTRNTLNSVETLHVARSGLEKLSPLSKNECVEKEPSKVCIDKVGDRINVTVPMRKAEQYNSGITRDIKKLDSRGSKVPLVLDEEWTPNAGQVKSWRTVVLESTNCGYRSDKGKAKRSSGNSVSGTCVCDHGGSIIPKLTPSGRAELDWSRLRSGDKASASKLYSLSDDRSRM